MLGYLTWKKKKKKEIKHLNLVKILNQIILLLIDFIL